MNLLIIFIILNIVNVILQTVKSICTVKCGKFIAAAANALAYGLYTIVIIYTNCELALIAKVAIVALSNFIGVYVVKFIEDKLNKDKLWKFEITFPNYHLEKINAYLNDYGIFHTSIIPIDDGKSIINCYCYSKFESDNIMKFVKDFELKFFVTESKISLSN